MIAICFKCGATKSSPMFECPTCGASPGSHEEQELSLMLTDNCLPREQLESASASLRRGQPISLFSGVGLDVFSENKSRRMSQKGRGRRGKVRRPRDSQIKAGVIGAIIAALFLFFHPWPHYQWAIYQDNVESYEGYVERFSNSKYTDSAMIRMRLLQEDDIWSNAKKYAQIEDLRMYRRYFPDGKYIQEANQLIEDIADRYWASIALTLSKDKVRKYIREYPESSKISDAQNRIVEIANYNWSQISGTQSKADILQYLKDNPETTKALEAKARIKAIEKALKNFEWERVSKSGSKDALLKFLRDNPETTKKLEVEALIKTIEELEWDKVSKSGSKYLIQKYLRENPGATKTLEAKALIKAIEDLEWDRLSKTRSKERLLKFLEDNPNTTKSRAVNHRIEELHNDWEWVQKQDTIYDYQRFASRFPSHKNIEWIKKRIIDLEVTAIAAGKHGQLPPAQPIRSGGTNVKIEIENKTVYTLTVRYSGPSSKKLVLFAGRSGSVNLAPGAYGVAASVDAANVTNYYGRDTMNAGRYSSSFYIQTSFER